MNQRSSWRKPTEPNNDRQNQTAGKLVVLGLVTIKKAALESKDLLVRRIEQAARFASLDQLCLSLRCGFASTSEVMR